MDIGVYERHYGIPHFIVDETAELTLPFKDLDGTVR